MKLLSVTRLAQRDPSSPGWFSRYLQQFNDMLRALNSGLDKNITLSENISCQEVKSKRFVTPSTYTASNGFTAIAIPKTLDRTATHVLVTHIVNASSPKTVIGTATTGVTCTDWNDDGQHVNVNFITGLSDSTTYEGTFLIF